MSNTVIARRYARALLNLAAEDDAIEEVGTGLAELAEMVRQSEDLREFLASPKVSQADQEQAVAELAGRMQPHRLLDVFVRYLCHKRRMLLLEDIHRVYRELADTRLGRAQAELIVATDLSGEVVQRLHRHIEALAGKDVELEVTVDPGILGGAITRIGSTVWDGSLRNKLRQIRQSIIEG